MAISAARSRGVGAMSLWRAIGYQNHANEAPALARTVDSAM